MNSKKELKNEVWSTDWMSEFYEKNRKTLAAWVKRGFPKKARGNYPVLACFQWWRKFILGQVEGQGDFQTEHLLRERAKRRLEECRAGREEGRLIKKSLAIAWISQIIVEAKSNFLTLPRRLAEVLAAEADRYVIEDILRKEIKQILTNLSEQKNKGIPNSI